MEAGNLYKVFQEFDRFVEVGVEVLVDQNQQTTRIVLEKLLKERKLAALPSEVSLMTYIIEKEELDVVESVNVVNILQERVCYALVHLEVAAQVVEVRLEHSLELGVNCGSELGQTGRESIRKLIENIFIKIMKKFKKNNFVRSRKSALVSKKNDKQ